MSCSASGEATRKRVMPPTLLLAGLVAVVTLRLVLPFLTYWTPITLAGGLMFMGAGIGLNLASDGAFKKRGTPVSPLATPSTLVTSGVFRFTRNPMYLGMTLIVAATALAIGAPAGLVVAIALLAILDRMFVPAEEHNLEVAFGETYRGYKARVRRWM